MKNNIYIIFVLFLMPFLMKAQDTEIDVPQNYGIIKYSPTSLVNFPFPAIQFAYEHNIAERRAMQYELGGLFLLKGQFGVNHDLTVMKVLSEHRWYKAPLSQGRNKFQGVGLRFQKQYRDEVEFGQSELLRLTKSYTSVGAYYTRGRQWKFDNSMTLEFGASLGVQYFDVSVLNIPDGAEEADYSEKGFFFNYHTAFPVGNFIRPMGFLYFKIGYDFKK